MNFGGAVWHASIAVARGAPWKYARKLALRALAGVGDPLFGEWEHRGAVAFHVRRRLSLSEAAIVGPVQDLRATPAGWARFDAIRWELPARLWSLAEQELRA